MGGDANRLESLGTSAAAGLSSEIGRVGEVPMRQLPTGHISLF